MQLMLIQACHSILGATSMGSRQNSRLGINAHITLHIRCFEHSFRLQVNEGSQLYQAPPGGSISTSGTTQGEVGMATEAPDHSTSGCG